MKNQRKDLIDGCTRVSPTARNIRAVDSWPNVHIMDYQLAPQRHQHCRYILGCGVCPFRLGCLSTLDSLGPRDWLVVSLVTIWGLRLSIHILIRNWGKGEDFRYVKMREDNGPQWWWKSYFKVFLFQGLLMWIVATPLTALQSPNAQDSLGIFDGVAIALGSSVSILRLLAMPN